MNEYVIHISIEKYDELLDQSDVIYDEVYFATFNKQAAHDALDLIFEREYGLRGTSLDIQVLVGE